MNFARAGVRFQAASDTYDIKLVHNASEDTLTLEFTESSSYRVYSRRLSKQHITTITNRCQLSPQNLYKLLAELLASSENIRKSFRLYKCADSKAAGKLCADFLKLDSVPSHVGGSVLDPAPSELQTTLLEIRNLHRENETLKNKLDATNKALQSTQTEMSRVKQALSDSTRSMKDLSRRVDKLEEDSDKHKGSNRKRKLPPSNSTDSNTFNSIPNKKAKTNSVKTKDMSIGIGTACKKGDKLRVYYVGQTEDKEVFDKAITGKGFEFTLGKGEVIKGWDIGCAGMKVSGKRKLIVPPELAYGSGGSPPNIGPNATLIFTVQLKAIN